MIVIDAGHGGRATRGSSQGPGRRGRRGTQEKDVTLALARAVADHLEEPVALTRSGDQNLSLAERQAVAAARGADVFLSLHAGVDAQGVGTYVHPLSNQPSIALGRHVERAAGLPFRRRHPLAVLDPWRLPAHTAAAVLEVDTLAEPDGEFRLSDPATLGLYGRRIARAVSTYLFTDGGRGREVVFGAVREAKVTCSNLDRSLPIFTAIGTDDPVGVIRAASDKALELLDNAIDDLESTRNRVLAGAGPGAPTVAENTAASLRVRMLLDPDDAAVWTGTGRRSVFVLLRWLRNIRKTLAADHMAYTCLLDDCPDSAWGGARPGQMRILLCRRWWRGVHPVDVDPEPSEEIKVLNRASTLIHETSHIFYDTQDDTGRGIWRADCIPQFLAEVNGVHIPKAFSESCGGPPLGIGQAQAAARRRGPTSSKRAAAALGTVGKQCGCGGTGRR